MTLALVVGLSAVGVAYAIAIAAMVSKGMPREAPAWYDPRRVLALNLALLDQLTLIRHLPLGITLERYRRSGEARIGIPFGSHGLCLDTFAPASGSATGLVVFLYGGAWGSGDRSVYGLVAAGLVRLGFAVVIPDYRLHPHARVDGMLVDVREALDWASAQAATLGASGSRVTVIGHSAGAHLAALLLVRAQRAADRAMLDRIERFIGLSGVYDIGDHYAHEHRRGVESVSPMWRVMGETAAAFAAASPSTQVQAIIATADLPPVTLVHGTKDATVPSTSSRKFAAALAAVGWPHSHHQLEGAGHVDTVIDLMRRGRWSGQLEQLIQERVHNPTPT